MRKDAEQERDDKQVTIDGQDVTISHQGQTITTLSNQVDNLTTISINSTGAMQTGLAVLGQTVNIIQDVQQTQKAQNFLRLSRETDMSDPGNYYALMSTLPKQALDAMAADAEKIQKANEDIVKEQENVPFLHG